MKHIIYFFHRLLTEGEVTDISLHNLEKGIDLIKKEVSLFPGGEIIEDPNPMALFK